MIRGKNLEEEPVWEEGRASCVDRVMELKSQKSFYRADPQRGFTVTERKARKSVGSDQVAASECSHGRSKCEPR